MQLPPKMASPVGNCCDDHFAGKRIMMHDASLDALDCLNVSEWPGRPIWIFPTFNRSVISWSVVRR
jgi:hypothetical protein